MGQSRERNQYWKENDPYYKRRGLNQQNNGGEERVISAENLQSDTTLYDISKDLKPGETLILDIGNSHLEQTDEINDTLIMRGYDVRKSFRNGKQQIYVSRRT